MMMYAFWSRLLIKLLICILLIICLSVFLYLELLECIDNIEKIFFILIFGMGMLYVVNLMI